MRPVSPEKEATMESQRGHDKTNAHDRSTKKGRPVVAEIKAAQD